MNLVELSVLVPEERVTEFYVMLGSWLAGTSTPAGMTGGAQGDAAAEGGRRRGGRRRGARAAMNSRYAGIATFLQGQSGDTAEASFGNLEEAIGNTLPASAERHRAWWANTERNTQARVWMEEGWRVDQVDFDRRTVTFSRS
ncbi:MAG: hypothetical protein WD273_01900 [Trueperaceae bacterium]